MPIRSGQKKEDIEKEQEKKIEAKTNTWNGQGSGFMSRIPITDYMLEEYSLNQE
jgi:hypothetical protein